VGRRGIVATTTNVMATDLSLTTIRLLQIRINRAGGKVADVNATAAIDQEKFGGQRPLYHTIVSLGDHGDILAK